MNLSLRKEKLSIFILPWLTWGIACLFYAHQYFLRISVTGMEPRLINNFHIDALTLSNVTASFFYAFILMQIPGGILINRFGAKKMLIAASMCCAIGCLLSIFPAKIYLFELGRFFIGFGAAFSVIITLALSQNWFTEKQFAILSGLIVTIGTFGAILGGAPLTILMQDTSIKTVMLGGAIISILITILAYFIVFDSPDKTVSTQQKDWKKTWQNIKSVARNKINWLCYFYMATLFLPIPTFAILWGTPFLTAKYHISSATADTASALTFIGIGFGAPFVAWISNILNNRTVIMRCGSLLALITALTVFYMPHIPFILSLLLLFIMGVGISSTTLSFVIIRSLVDKTSGSISYSVANMFKTLGGALSLPLIGWILEVNWTGDIIHNVEIYHMNNYHVALAIIPFSIFISLIVSFFIPEPRWCQV